MVAVAVVATVGLAGGSGAGAVEPPTTVDPAEPLPDVDPIDVIRGDDSIGTRAGGGTPLVGTFGLDPGDCDGPAGTYFRMAQPAGTPEAGPFVQNNDSPCDDTTITPLRPGSDGGLVTGSYQPHPTPAFDGNAGLASRITEPEPFFGTDFAVATNSTDPQTGTDVVAPSISADGSGNLSGDLRAFAAAWQTQHFNQGSPKPDGSTGTGTNAVTGTYDADTGRFVIQWSSRIQGGAFNNFTGVWHLEGVFRPADGAGTRQAPTPTDPGTDSTSPPGASTAGGTGGVASPQTPTPQLSTGAASPDGLANTGGGALHPVALVALAAAVTAAVVRRRVLA